MSPFAHQGRKAPTHPLVRVPLLCSLSMLFYALTSFVDRSSHTHYKIKTQHAELPRFLPVDGRSSVQSLVFGQLTDGGNVLGDKHTQRSPPQLHHHPDKHGHDGPPYVLPKLIHQPVQDKHDLPNAVQDNIQSWIDMNPGYTHIMYDAADQLKFVTKFQPELLPLFNALPSNRDRTNLWKYLVLHKLGGVYAESDVKCMQSITSWNEENGFDAALIIGIAKRNMRTGDTTEFIQFVMAAMPGHPLLVAMPLAIASNLTYTHYHKPPVKINKAHVDEGILMQTWTKTFTSVIQTYTLRVGAEWPINSTQADLEGGVLCGSVRAMPAHVLGMDWGTHDINISCDEVRRKLSPEALVCHQPLGVIADLGNKQQT